ncbi:hypothetical protein [Nonomuraea typhae]|uniref:Uncharacterized protein n=1 Tax=Nonomuraea typhae TaxID=2603600 RepID=A0ABW7YJF1_9ACTN
MCKFVAAMFFFWGALLIGTSILAWSDQEYVSSVLGGFVGCFLAGLSGVIWAQDG